MINKQVLWKNWELRETPYDLKAEIRLHIPLTGWEAYLIALNPENDDECIALVNTPENGWICEETAFWGFETLVQNSDEQIIDKEYRPRLVKELIKILNKRKKK